MKLKNKARLLNELVKSAETPKEFIHHCMALQNQYAADVAQEAGITVEHFYVAMSQIEHGGSMGIGLCVKISKGLDIDPTILCRKVADYNLKNYLSQQSQ